MSEPAREEEAVSLPAEVEKRILELHKAHSDEARIELAAKMTSAYSIIKPFDPAQEMSPAEISSVEAATGDIKPDFGTPAYTVIRVARKEIGYKETGDNGTKYGVWYGHGLNHQPWCDVFVSWVFAMAHQLGAIGGKHSYVPDHFDWFRRHKRFHHRGAKGGGPRGSCLVFFDINGRGGADHIGIVDGYSDTHVYTIEGNAGRGSSYVTANKYPRSSHLIYGYGYPHWG